MTIKFNLGKSKPGVVQYLFQHNLFSRLNQSLAEIILSSFVLNLAVQLKIILILTIKKLRWRKDSIYSKRNISLFSKWILNWNECLRQFFIPLWIHKQTSLAQIISLKGHQKWGCKHQGQGVRSAHLTSTRPTQDYDMTSDRTYLLIWPLVRTQEEILFLSMFEVDSAGLSMYLWIQVLCAQLIQS